MLKLVTKEVPEGLEAYYEKLADGTFRLAVEGVVPEEEHRALVAVLKDKNKELRDTNTGLLKTNDSLSSFSEVFGVANVSPEAIQRKIDELATERANRLSETAAQAAAVRVRELEAEIQTKGQRLSALTLGQEVQKAGAKHGVVQTGYEDVLRRAQADFEVTDEGVRFRHERNDAEGKPYTVDTWMVEQAQSAPHLFARSQGTGAARPVTGVAQQPAVGSLNGTDLIASGLNQLTAGNGARRLN